MYELNFKDLISKLISKTNNILGCPINFPDTAFFDDKGRITMIVKSDKEGYLV